MRIVTGVVMWTRRTAESYFDSGSDPGTGGPTLVDGYCMHILMNAALWRGLDWLVQ